MVDILLRQADELLVAAEDGGYAQGLVGHVVALVLDLAIVNNAVALHGGTIAAFPNAGGVRFVFTTRKNANRP